MRARTRSLIELNTATLLFGFVGPFGKAITLAPSEIVFWRTALASGLLFAVGRRRGGHSKIRSRRDLLAFVMIADIIALQSWLFFESVRLSTVAFALISIYTYPILMVFLEARFFGEKLSAVDFISALLVPIGIFCITPEFDLSQ